MSKELILKLKETVKQQKSKIDDLKSDISYYRERNKEHRDKIGLIQCLFNIQEKYYEISFSGINRDVSPRRIEETEMVKGYNKTHAIQSLLRQYSPFQDIKVSSIKCLSDD